MNITHVISSIDKASGGPSRSTTHLLSKMGQLYPNSNFHLHTANSRNPIIDEFSNSNVDLTFYELNSLGKLKGLENELNSKKTSIFHGQGLWQLPVHQMVKMARKRSIPYIITPRGMLDSWSLEQSKIKKRVALKLYQYKDLAKAKCIQVTAEKEANFVRSLGLINPIAIIPNGIPLDDFKLKNEKNYNTSRNILFLSRIHPKKGIEMLILAWSKLPAQLRKEWKIDIVGYGNQKYIDRLKSLMQNKGVFDDFQFLGSLEGRDKTIAYQNADIFVLPTHTENFGVVIAEALACGTPVITTEGAPWNDLLVYDCGWWTQIGEKPLQRALSDAMKLPKNELINKGIRGNKLIRDKYSMNAVAKDMNELYNWILELGPKPDFVV